jgi:hypothetical protein
VESAAVAATDCDTDRLLLYKSNAEIRRSTFSSTERFAPAILRLLHVHRTVVACSISSSSSSNSTTTTTIVFFLFVSALQKISLL